MSDKPTIAERYAKAATASNLTVQPDPTPVDMLIAAGMASRGSETKALALVLWRMREGDLARFNEASEVLNDWLRKKAKREGFMDGGKQGKHLVVRRTLFWWLNPACTFCDGRGHPVIANSPVLDESRNCEHCAGTGIYPLERMVRQEYIYAAKALANELDRVTAAVFGEMRRLTRNGGGDGR